MMTNDTYGEVRGEGEDRAVDEQVFQEIFEELDLIRTDLKDQVWWSRQVNEDFRYARWAYQSSDGLKRTQDGYDPEPYDGAFDSRIRLADMIINERVMLLVLSALGSKIQVGGMEQEDMKKAKWVKILLNWLIDNELGQDYFIELCRLAQFMNSDSPAAAVMKVYAHKEHRIRRKHLTLNKLVDDMVALSRRPELRGLANVVVASLVNGDEKKFADFLQKVFGYISKRTAKRVAKELKEKGETTFPERYVKGPDLRLEAKRVYQDIFFRWHVMNFQRLPIIIDRQWMTKVELKQAVHTQGWSEDFVEEVLQHDGASYFEETYYNNTTGEEFSVQEDYATRKGYYEILHPYFKAVDEDGYIGIFTYPMSAFVSFAGSEVKLIEDFEDEFSFVCFTREVLTKRLMDSRSLTELLATDQNALKLQTDAFADHTTLKTMPTFTRLGKAFGASKLSFGPLEQNLVTRHEEIKPVDLGEYPRASVDFLDRTQLRIDAYCGRRNPHLDPKIAILHEQFMVASWLVGIKEVVMKMMSLAIQHFSDEKLARITGSDAQWVRRHFREIQGNYDVKLYFDVRDMDLEYLKVLADMVQKILQFDSSKVIQPDRLVEEFFHSLNPNLSRMVLQPAERGSEMVYNQAKKDLVHIVVGIEPSPPEDETSAQFMLKALMELVQANPEIQQKLTPTSMEILKAHVGRLTQMARQEENKVIGRQGALSPLTGRMPVGLSGLVAARN